MRKTCSLSVCVCVCPPSSSALLLIHNINFTFMKIRCSFSLSACAHTHYEHLSSSVTCSHRLNESIRRLFSTHTHTDTAVFAHKQPSLSLFCVSSSHQMSLDHANMYVTHANMLPLHTHTVSSLSLSFPSVPLCLSTFVHPAQDLAATFKRHGDHGEAKPRVASPPSAMQM